MSGMLNQGMQGGFDPEQLLQMLQAQGNDPFLKPMPGDDLLGAGNMAMPQQQMGQQGMQGQQQPQMPGLEQAPMGGDMPPGLPNIPQNMGGFGLGQFAPKEFQPVGIRQQLIQALMQQLGAGGGF